MKVKTSELKGPALAHAVAMALGAVVTTVQRRTHLGMAKTEVYSFNGVYYLTRRGVANNRQMFAHLQPWRPDMDWAQGGPLLARYGMLFLEATDGFVAVTRHGKGGGGRGPDHLTAAMRAVVAVGLGEEVAVPDELVQGGNNRGLNNGY